LVGAAEEGGVEGLEETGVGEDDRGAGVEVVVGVYDTGGIVVGPWPT